MPKISETFSVTQAVAEVWAFLQDVPAVVTCLPGLELTGQPAEQVYQGRIRVKLGAVTAAFEGEATIIESDARTHTTRIKGKGIDKKGGSRAQAEFVYRLTAIATGTQVVVDAEINLSGPLAQFGRTSILNDVARELTAQFATNLNAKLAPRDAVPPRTEARPVAPTTLSGSHLLWVLIKGRWRALCAAFRRHFGQPRS
jgi:uncharacterized protein